MINQLLIIGVIVLLLSVGLSGCNEINNGNGGNKNISVSISEPYIGGLFDKLYIDVTISGEKSDYYLFMSDFNGDTVGESNIAEINMLDGIETASILIGEDSYYNINEYKTYLLVILDDYPHGNEVYKTSLSYLGANISIQNCSSPSWFYNSVYDKYNLDDFFIYIYNQGDLPAPIGWSGDVKVIIQDVESMPYLFADENVERHGNTVYIYPGILGKIAANRDNGLARLTGGEHLMRVQIYHDNVLIEEFSTTVNIE